MNPRSRGLKECSLVAALVCSMGGATLAQTFKVNSGSTAEEQKPAQNRSAQPQSADKSLGWGSNIQNARLARAAESALKSGNFSTAVDFAQRAAQSAPNDAQLWFLLGYAARLAGKSQLSVDAYDHGLRINPSSLEGQSGLAQTYSRMGRRGEAQKILTRVLAVDPKRTGDLLLLGEMELQDGQPEQALLPLQRAEQLQPAPR